MSRAACWRAAPRSRQRRAARGEGRQPQGEPQQHRVLHPILQVGHRAAAALVAVAVERQHVGVAVVLEGPELVAGAGLVHAAPHVGEAEPQPEGGEREGDEEGAAALGACLLYTSDAADE